MIKIGLTCEVFMMNCCSEGKSLSLGTGVEVNVS